MKRRLVIWLLVLALVGFGVYKLLQKEPETSSQQSTSNGAQTSGDKKSVPFIDLQPTVEAWDAQVPGQASVVVYDLANKQNVASLNPDTQYFTASIYKLYVAYAGYQKIADGTYGLNDSYLSGYSRGKCLDAMIRDSYSPCGEKMWAELGKDTVTNQLKTYGLSKTSMAGLLTSAQDAAIVLQRLFERRELTETHTNLFLDSMKTQPALYRRGLPSGFTNATVYNKVGWNEQIEWHDTAIVTLANGRSYIITVFTKNVGAANIASLAKVIEAKLTQ